MKHTEYFEEFLKNEVNLNQTRIDKLDDSVAAVEGYIQGTELFKEHFIEFIPQGSYAHRTIIKPARTGKEFDADVLLHMSEVDGWSPKDYVENLYVAFRSSSIYRDMVSRRTRCVMVNYAGDFHMDVVPMVTRSGLQYVANRHLDSYQWTKTVEFTSWLEERERITGGHFVHVVRLLKYLRDIKMTFAVKSIILSTLLGGRVETYDAINWPGCYDDLPTALRTIVKNLNAYLQANEQMPTIYDPGGTGEDFGRRWDQEGYRVFRDKIKFYFEKIDEAYSETEEAKSVSKWQAVFGEKFVAPKVEQSKSVLASYSSLLPVSEQWIQHLGYPLRLDPRYQVRITGYVKKLAGMGAYYLRDRGDRVGKRRSIEFRVVSCNVPSPEAIFWKVKNLGDEALAAGQLRGEISRDDGSRIHAESTSYRGNHYVECYVIKGGTCVAMDRQLVIVNSR
ncbi:MAG: SMODS domain-containing nucleotidyltransferase [Fimbriimonas sp.]